jgi:hypothetical protein
MAAAASGAEPPAPAPLATQPVAQLAPGCRKDLSAFSDLMEKGGYWLGGSGDGYGYPLGGMGVVRLLKCVCVWT